jgi:hypothetical protein
MRFTPSWRDAYAQDQSHLSTRFLKLWVATPRGFWTYSSGRCLKYSCIQAHFWKVCKTEQMWFRQNISRIFSRHYRESLWHTLGAARFESYLGSCCHHINWQVTATKCRTAIFVTVRKPFIGYCSFREVVKLFRFLLSPYSRIRTCNNMQNCNFRDCTGTVYYLL